MNPVFRASLFGTSFPLLFIFSSYAQAHVEELTTDSLKEVVVTASRVSQTVDEALAAVQVISRKQIETSQITSIVELLRKYSPSVDFSVRGGMGKNSSIYLRGTNSDHVLVLIDGVRAGSATTGAMAWSLLPTSLIEQVEIVRGPRSSLYGSDAIGGIVSITTRKGNVGSWHSSISAGSYNSKEITAGTTLGNNKTQVSINASYLDTDGIDTKVTNNADKDGYDNQGLNLQVQHKFTDQTDISLTALYEKGSSEYDDFGDDNRNSHNDFLQQNMGLKVNTDLTTKWHTSLFLGESRDESEAFDGFPSVFNTKRHQLNWQNDLSLGKDSLLTMGVDYQKDKIGTTTAYTKNSRDNTGVYAEYMGYLAGHDYQVSLRNDDNEAFGQHSTGGFSVGRYFGTGSRLIASYGTAFKAPTFNELYFPNFGNAALKPEESKTLEIGLRTYFGKAQLNANIFRTDISHLIAAVLIDPATFAYEAQNVDKARIDGMELGLTQSFNQFNVNANWTLLNPKDRNTAHVLEGRVKQTLKLNLDRDFGRLSLGGSLLAQSKRAKGTFSQVLAGYTTADLRASYSINKHLKLKAELNNILDKDYQTKDGYNMPNHNAMFTVSYQ